MSHYVRHILTIFSTPGHLWILCLMKEIASQLEPNDANHESDHYLHTD